MSKIILERAIDKEQIAKLLETGKTDLLTKFISKKGRPFSAYLVKGIEGKIGFEFEQKSPKKPAQSKAKAKPAQTKSSDKTAS